MAREFKRADRVAAHVRADQNVFPAAAARLSAHAASRSNGGFMGLLEVSELVPECSL